MIAAGQIYKFVNKTLPFHKYQNKFVITRVNFTQVYIIWDDDTTDVVGLNWVAEDCKLLAEFDDWKLAVSSVLF